MREWMRNRFVDGVAAVVTSLCMTSLIGHTIISYNILSLRDNVVLMGYIWFFMLLIAVAGVLFYYLVRGVFRFSFLQARSTFYSLIISSSFGLLMFNFLFRKYAYSFPLFQYPFIHTELQARLLDVGLILLIMLACLSMMALMVIAMRVIGRIYFKRIRYTAPISVLLMVALLFSIAWAKRERVPHYLTELQGPPRKIMRTDTGYKVTFLAVDALSFDLMKTLVNEGKLKNFSKLIDQGASGKLATEIPTLSARIWYTIYTGKSAEEHNIRDMVVFRFRGMKHPFFIPNAIGIKKYIFLLSQHSNIVYCLPILRSQNRVDSMWDILESAGLSSNIGGPWASWPVKPLPGSIFSDVTYDYLKMSANKNGGKLDIDKISLETYAYPTDFMTSVIRDLPMSDLLLQEKDCRSFFDQKAEFKFRIFQAQRKAFDAPLSMLYIRNVDEIGHTCHFCDEGQCYPDNGPYREMINDPYYKDDQLLGEYLESMPDNEVLIITSDHGFRTLFISFKLEGSHWFAPRGTIILYGKPVKHSFAIENATIYDVAPTILYLLGFPKANDMPGHILTEALDPDFVKKFPPLEIDTYEPQEGKAVEGIQVESPEVREQLKQLGALGYLK